MTWYGVEETTDANHRKTVIKRFSSERSAIRWTREKGVHLSFAWDGAANESLRMTQQNWHRRLRYAFRMPPGWRRPTAKQLRKRFSGDRPWEDNRSTEDLLAIAILSDGVDVRK